jgi:hypothetical protein
MNDVVDGEGHRYDLLAGSVDAGRLSRRVEVELGSGDVGILHAHSTAVRNRAGTLVTVLELRRDRPHVAPGGLTA